VGPHPKILGKFFTSLRLCSLTFKVRLIIVVLHRPIVRLAHVNMGEVVGTGLANSNTQ
jgi:hypothetical protein